MRIIRRLQIATVCACLLATGLLGRASGYQLGDMPANQILFLGNSITFCPQPPDQVEWWGLSASDPNHDYAHLLTQKINAATGGSLAIVPPNPSQGSPEDPSTGGETRWYYGDPLPNYNGNIINICDLFELNYNTWDNARLQNQIDAKPDLVVLQFGENMNMGAFDAATFKNSLETLANGLENSSDPNIFMTSFILGSNPSVDAIKQQVCAEDPSHRVYVDLSSIRQDPSNFDSVYGHPNDQGMALIANTIYNAMDAHSIVPEPGSCLLLVTALLALLAWGWRKRR